MIYLFTWNSDFLVREKTLSWKKLFTEKNWDFNLVHFKNLAEIDNNQIIENLLAEWFMWEKKLIIIEDFPLSWTNKVWASNKKSILSEKQDFLESIIKQIPNNNIVIFSSSNPDKRWKFYKLLKKEATKVEEFNTKTDQETGQIISKKYGNHIDYNSINLLLRYKWWSLEKSISEIQKLLITRDTITAKDIQNYVKPELEESIFQVIDNIMDVNPVDALNKIKHILDDTNIYAFYNNLLANLRTSIYISKLKNLKNSPAEITSHLNLWNKSFLVNKNHRIKHSQLEKFYIALVELDKKMKSWKLLWTTEDDFQFEIEKAIVSLKQ